MHLSQKDIIKLSLTGFILLFSILIYIDSIYTLPTSQIQNISIKNINQYVSVESKIGKQSIIKNMSFFELYDKTGKLTAIMFNLNNTLNKSKTYNFIGKITIYKNEPELNIYEIKSLPS